MLRNIVILVWFWAGEWLRAEGGEGECKGGITYARLVGIKSGPSIWHETVGKYWVPGTLLFCFFF